MIGTLGTFGTFIMICKLYIESTLIVFISLNTEKDLQPALLILLNDATSRKIQPSDR